MSSAAYPLTGPRVPPAQGAATHLVVLCHGYGADGNDLIALAPHWQTLMPGAAFVAPNGPEPCAAGPGYQWFPISRLDPHEIAHGVASAAPILNGFIESELAHYGLAADRLALVGFSQGTMLSLAVGLTRGAKPAAILGFSGLLAGGIAPELGADCPPILLIHGDADPMIPADALFMSAGALGAAGAAVQWHLSAGVGHGIDETALVLGGTFLAMAFAGRLARVSPQISCPLS
jgi:phospholipase/carboxylesterase